MMSMNGRRFNHYHEPGTVLQVTGPEGRYFAPASRVEQEMKEIAKAYSRNEDMEQSTYLDAPENASASQGGQETLSSTRSQIKRRHRDGRDELVHVSSPELEREFAISIYKNPLWSKWMSPKTNICGGPPSVRMVASLDEAEVLPTDCDILHKVQYISVDKRGNTGIRDKHPRPEAQYTFTSQETAEPLKNLRSSADDSSSSGESGNMLIQALSGDQNYDLSSGDSGATVLHLRDRSEVSEDDSMRRHTRRQKCELEDYDSKNNSCSSDDASTNPPPFVGEAREQLAILPPAKVQTGRLSPESLAQVTTIYKQLPSKTSEKAGSDAWITETYEGEPEFPEEQKKKKKKKSTVATALRPEKLTAREIQELHLLERRVEREFGAPRRNTKAADSQDEQGISEPSNVADDDAKAENVFSSGQHHCTRYHDPSEVVLEALTGDDMEGAKILSSSSPLEQPNGPVSSVVKLFFGAKREQPRRDEDKTANNLQEVSLMIRRKVELLEAEIRSFTKGNRRIKILLKEQDERADQFKREKAAWEQQKASDVEAFQKFKDAEMSKLQKERTKMEQQARAAMSKPPRKEERSALDELKAKLAWEQEAHTRKEEKWRLTSNRLRKANVEHAEEINELRKEIRRLEEQILLELDARGCPSDTCPKSSRKMATGRKDMRRPNPNPLTLRFENNPTQ